MFDIEQFLNIDDYITDTRLSRRKNNEKTNEFFTPYSIVKRMCDKIPESDWSDPDKTFLEPCFGNGQFVIYIIYNRIIHGIDWQTALETTFGVELMQDNVDECKDRVIDLLNSLGIAFYETTARDIMDHNFVCHDFFTWNFEEWREYTEEELEAIEKEAKKKKKSK